MTEQKIAEPKGEKPSWLTMKPAEVEKLVLDLAKQGNAPANIGVILRDTHGIPKTKLLGKKIKKIMDDAGQPFPSEQAQIETKIRKLEHHRAQHKQDHTAQRSLAKKLWILSKLKNA